MVLHKREEYVFAKPSLCCVINNELYLARSPDCLASMRQECSLTINGTLSTFSRLPFKCFSILMSSSETATGIPTAIMNYNNYDVNVVLKYKVRLAGWPLDKFISPYNFNTIDELRDLRDALRCGSCFWMGLSSREVAQHVKEMKERTEAGEVLGKKRKERSDKGSKKGPRKRPAGEDEVNSDDETPAKRRKVTSKKAKGSTKGQQRSAKSQVPPTSEMIDSGVIDSDDEV